MLTACQHAGKERLEAGRGQPPRSHPPRPLGGLVTEGGTAAANSLSAAESGRETANVSSAAVQGTREKARDPVLG